MSAPLAPTAWSGAAHGWRTWRNVGARRRATIARVAALLVVTLVLAYGVLPFARRWIAREAVIDARAARLASLRGLTASQAALAAAVRAREERVASRGAARPVEAPTAALAAAALQAALQGVVLQGGMQLQRVEVAAPADDAMDGALPTLSATMVAMGDVHGLAALLDGLRTGSTLHEVTALDMRPVAGPRDESLLQLTVVVRAPWSPSATPTGSVP